MTGPAVSGTDSDFPFAWYLQAVESKVVANWKPRQLGFGDRAVVSCSVHFVINRAGVGVAGAARAQQRPGRL